MKLISKKIMATVLIRYIFVCMIWCKVENTVQSNVSIGLLQIGTGHSITIIQETGEQHGGEKAGAFY